MSRKAHDISGGIDFTGGQAEFAKNIFYSVLGWFSITIEAFIRTDFGERYYTKGNFFVGWMLVGMITFFGQVFASSSFSWYVFAMWKGFWWLSMFHFWKIWVNNQIGSPQHSIYGGISRLQPLGRLIMKFLNPLSALLARIVGRFTLSGTNYKRLDESLKLSEPFKNEEEFTKKWIEPLLIFFLATFSFRMGEGILGFWLFICSLSLLVHTHMGYDISRHDELDVSDSIIDAAFQKEDIEGQRLFKQQMREALATVQERALEDPEYLEELKEDNPSVLDVLAELDVNLQNLGERKEAA